jgi:site-specific DNA-cytosine methylase
MGNHPQATPQQLQQLEELLQQEIGAFAYAMKDLPGYCGPLGPAHFELIEDKPMFSPARKYTEPELALGDKKVGEMLEADIIYEVPTLGVRHAQAPTMPLKRLPDGSWGDIRFALDSRHINANTVVDKYGMPLPEELFRQMAGASFFTKLDMRSGFFQVELDLPSQLQTVFHWRGKCYAFRRLPFGHVNATAIFQRRMELELQAAGLQHCTCVFVDDVCVYSSSMEEHLQQLRQLLRHFQKANLRAHPAKTIVATDCIPYLGHLVTGKELKPEPAKIAAMTALQPPDCVKRLQAHLGLLNYYRCYIPNFALIAQPLYALLKQSTKWLWGAAQDRAYEQLKAALCTPGLALRQPDPSRPFRLYTDWSTSGIAAVLNQLDDQGREYLVACVSRSLNDAEKQYPAWKGELLAAVFGVRAFRPYLLTRRFQLITDHKALLWMLKQQRPTGQLARWILSVSEYQFSLVHRAGVDNPADLPSREPQPATADWTGSRLDSEQVQCPVPAVFRPDGSPDLHGYTAEELDVHVSEGRKPARCPKQRTAVSAAAQLQPDALLRPSQTLAAAAGSAVPSSGAAAQQALHALAAISAAASSGIDQYDPNPRSAASLLGGSLHLDQAADTPAAWHPARAWHPAMLRPAAARWVQLACSRPVPPAARQACSAPLPGRYDGPPDQRGIRPTQQLCTASVACSFFPAAQHTGITLYEPFGGLCAGLEATLRLGIRVSRYLYSDISPTARAVAAVRLQQLRQEFPSLLSKPAVSSAFSCLPADVRHVTSGQLAALVDHAPAQQWLVVAGWPCQDLSQAGRGAGLAGQRSQLLHDLLRIVGTLQQLQPSKPPGYSIENVAFQLNPQQRIAQQDFASVCSSIGHPVLLDAAQFGSLAHRLRNYWTNLATPKQLAGSLQQVVRPAARTVHMAMLPGRLPQPVQRAPQWPYYPCNQPAQPRAAWPTLMAKEGSYAFRPGQPGSVWDSRDPAAAHWDEPTAEEREFALGYLPGSTAAAGLSPRQRCELLGQCIDGNALQGLLALAHAWWQAGGRCAAHNPAAANSSTAAAAQAVPSSRPSSMSVPGYSTVLAVYTAAAAQEVLASQDSSTEVWLDHPTLTALQQGELSGQPSNAARHRVRQRLKLYSWDSQQQQLLRNMPDGGTRIVPPPAERQQLIKQQHELCGHYGIRRTAAMLATKYWWHGMLADTAAVVNKCGHCSRVAASFNQRGNRSELQSIPISSLGFRWHVDLAGPFPDSKRGNRYVMVAVEAFSKWLEAVPMPNKESATVAHAFLHSVLARFAAPGQVVSDNGDEFTTGPFADLLASSLIDHCTTSAYHPQANGQAEKAVATVKQALRKMCLQRHSMEDWDTDVAWLALGYRCTPHSSTGFTPYELLYARQAVVPPAIRSAVLQPINYESQAVAVKDLLQRKELVQRLCPEALANLQVAQQRDQRRYAVTRSPGYQPRTYSFQPGDYVYLRQHNRAYTLQPHAKPGILRVYKVLPSGVLQLQGKCGRIAEAHIDNCAPCHLPHLDGDIDPRIADDFEDAVCEVCEQEEPEATLLLCDLCNSAYHTACLQPPLAAVPEDSWICPVCVTKGYTVADVHSQQQQRQQLAQQQQLPQMFPDAAMRKRDAAAAALDQRLVRRLYPDASGQPAPFWGRVHFRGPQHRPYYFLVVYQDGQQEECTKRKLSDKILQPEGTRLPRGVAIPPPSCDITSATPQPA